MSKKLNLNAYLKSLIVKQTGQRKTFFGSSSQAALMNLQLLLFVVVVLFCFGKNPLPLEISGYATDYIYCCKL